MNELFRICGLALAALISIVVIKQVKPDLALPVTITGCVITAAYALSRYVPSVGYISEIVSESGFGKYGTVMLKALGAGLISQTAADVCRDAGESALASKVEFAGKAEILLIALPLVEDVLKISSDMIRG